MALAETHEPINRFHAPFGGFRRSGFGRLERLKNDILGVFKRTRFETPVNKGFHFWSGDLDRHGGVATSHYRVTAKSTVREHGSAFQEERVQ